jgi:hypothetical protein
MAKLGSYCKAYPLAELRKYQQWNETTEVAALPGDTYVFLQEDYTVTRDIYLDDELVFRDSDPAWETFCREELGFDRDFVSRMA